MYAHILQTVIYVNTFYFIDSMRLIDGIRTSLFRSSVFKYISR
jgi:hypothetical protein